MSVETLLRANRIDDPRHLPAGTRIFVPGAVALPGDEAPPLADAGPLIHGCTLSDELKQERQSQAKREADISFEWPVRGTVTTCFAPENGRPHDGIDIAVPEGTPVHAAEAGKVVYSAPLGAYGNLVVVRHAGEYTSLYAHNEKNLAEPGDFVEGRRDRGVRGERQRDRAPRPLRDPPRAKARQSHALPALNEE